MSTTNLINCTNTVKTTKTRPDYIGLDWVNDNTWGKPKNYLFM